MVEAKGAFAVPWISIVFAEKALGTGYSVMTR